jgi:peptide/nickel transport system ATP-binding protein
MTATSLPLLAIDNLSVSIGDAAIIRNISLTVGRGEIVGLVGASGSGKSMTALAIMQLLPSGATQGGTVSFRGGSITELSDPELQRIRGKDIAVIFQEPMSALNPLMTIGAQVVEAVHLHTSARRARARTMARESLESVGLLAEHGAFERYPHELSGGQRQRAAVAMATVLNPALLVADEPTTALDVGAQAQVLSLLRELARARQMGLILISHDLTVVSKIADRVVVMQAGRIVEEAATFQIGETLRHPYSRALIAAAQSAPKSMRRLSASGAPVLEVNEVVVEYPRRRRSVWHRAEPLRAVNGASLEVFAGETIGLVGESGSGKSSLLRSILALEKMHSGAVRLHGEAFSTSRGAGRRRLRRSMQAVFQDPYGSFDPRWSVARLVAEPFFLMESAPPKAEVSRRVAIVLEQVGLSAADAARHPREFSGGQRQRIAIARALITEPALILFDEAVSALDVLLRSQILILIADLAARLQLAYLFVSHDLNVVRSICDRIYVMQRGRIVEQGPTEELFAAPKHSYTQALIAAIPRL